MNQILNFQVILCASTLYAFGIGCTGPPVQRFIEEYLPEKFIGPLFAVTQIITQIAALLGALSVRILPPDDDTEALKNNNTWRILSFFPNFFMIAFLICLLTCIRDEAPKFYLHEKGSEKKAKAVIHKIYETGGSDDKAA